MHERRRAIAEYPHAIDRIALKEAAAIAARLESQAAVLAGDVLRDLVQLGARRVAAAHRIVSDYADPAADVVGGNRLRGALQGSLRLQEQ